LTGVPLSLYLCKRETRYEQGRKIIAFSDIELQKVKKIVGGLCSEKTPDH
jgi:hypothetical protein